MSYPVNIRLSKLNSEEVWIGLMWEYSKPKFYKPFSVKESKLQNIFTTTSLADVMTLENYRHLLRTVDNIWYELKIIK